MAKTIHTPSGRTFQVLTGQTFHRLTVVSHFGKKRGQQAWHCRCICGGQTICTSADLKRGHSKSCGCLQRERVKSTGEANRTHGLTQHPEFNIWNCMIRRCCDTKHPRYADYGGRGITVCDRWRESPANFFADMGPRPRGYTIERKNNDRGYCPDNCEWIPKPDQNKNTRETRLISFNGETLHLAEWTRRLRMSHSVIQNRLKRGWTIAEALTTPVSRSNKLRTLRKHRSS